jgi:DNA end-binding protein Ku
MALRTSWEGFLKLSLISVPVRAYNAAVSGGGDIHFHQIHKECGSRIRYQKVCPIHGEVSKDEIVKGYEYKKNEYVELDPTELAKLRAEDDQSLNIDAFLPANSVDALHLSGRTYFLVPDGPPGQKAYALLHQVMKQKRKDAVATIVLSGQEETVLLRPMEKLLTMTVLYYDSQIKPSADFEKEIKQAKISAQELKLAETLVEASSEKQLQLSGYKDHYQERTREAIQAKMAGKKPTQQRVAKHPRIVNLMDALRKSVSQKQDKRKSAPRLRNSPAKRKARQSRH